MIGRHVRRYPAGSFFVLATCISWAFMVPLALAHQRRIGPLPGWIHYLGAYGPLLAAVAVSRWSEGPAGTRALWLRVTRWRADRLAWIVALSPLILYAIASAIARAVNGAWPDARLLGNVNFLPPLGLWALPLWILNSGLGEESGWRGFALPMLQRRFGPRRASLVVAAAWMIWHVPAFFYLPSYAQLGAGTLVGFFVGILSGSFLLTWLANRAGGSALLPIVWHGLFNFTTAPPSSGGLVAAVSSTTIVVMGFVAAWRLRGGPRSVPTM